MNPDEIIKLLLDENLIVYKEGYRLTDKFNKFKIWYKQNKFIQEESESVFDFEQWIINWNNKFPTAGVTKKRNIRSSKVDVAERMKKFIEKYKYSPEIIDRATDNYLLREKTSNYQFTKESAYFISKRDEPSKLLSECEQVISDLESGKINLNSEIDSQDSDYQWTKLAD